MKDLLENLHAAGSYHAKRKVVNAEHNKNFTKEWKEMALYSDNPNLLALTSTRDLAANGRLTMHFFTNQCNVNRIS